MYGLLLLACFSILGCSQIKGNNATVTRVGSDTELTKQEILVEN